MEVNPLARITMTPIMVYAGMSYRGRARSPFEKEVVQVNGLKWSLAVVVALVIVAISSAGALATNYSSPPPLDQIQPGDTLDYGDASIKVVTMGSDVRGQAAIEAGESFYARTDI